MKKGTVLLLACASVLGLIVSVVLKRVEVRAGSSEYASPSNLLACDDPPPPPGGGE